MNKSLLFLFLLAVSFLVPGACRNRQEPVVVDEEKYLILGDSLSRISFDTLRNTLLRKVSTDGLAGAVLFCKAEASTLTGTYRTDMQEIGRVSLRFRNPENKPDSLSDAVLTAMQADMDRGVQPGARLVADPSGTYHYFKPIFMQAMCLNCHGSSPGELSPELASVMDSLYPGDLARNYKEGDLRGAWHIRFGKGSGQ